MGRRRKIPSICSSVAPSASPLLPPPSGDVQLDGDPSPFPAAATPLHPLPVSSPPRSTSNICYNQQPRTSGGSKRRSPARLIPRFRTSASCRAVVIPVAADDHRDVR